MQAESEVVDLLGDSDSDDGGVVVIEQRPATPAASVSSARKRRRRAPNRDDEVVVLDDDADDDVVMLPPPTRAGNGNGKKKRRKAASGAAIEVLDGDVEEVKQGDAAWLHKLQLPPQACERCGGVEHVLRLHGCGHGVCLPCLRGPYEDMALTGGAGPGEQQQQQQQPALRCPVAHCSRSLLSAADALHLLAPADFDAYAQRRLKAFVAEMQTNTEVAACPSCGETPRIRNTGGGKNRKRNAAEGKGKGKGKGTSKQAAWEKAAAVESPSPLVLECPATRCDLLYCVLCHTALAPASDHQAWHASHERAHSGCACLPLHRLAALEAATATLLGEEAHDREGKGSKAKAAAAASSAASSGSKGKWAAGTGYGGGAGYGGGSETAAAQLKKQEAKAKARQEEEDAAYLALLKLWLQALPPTPQTPLLPETQHLLARAFRQDRRAVSSPLLRLLVQLLRNDSIMDMAARQEVYQAALDLVMALAAHPLVAPVLERPIDEEAKDGEGEEEGAKAGGGSSSSPGLLALLEQLHSQAAFHTTCGGKAVQGAQISAQEEAALFQDLKLSTKITDTHAAVTKRLQDHKQQYFLELQAYHAVGGKLGHAEGEQEAKGSGDGKRRAPSASAAGKAKVGEAAANEEAEADATYKRTLGALRLEPVPLVEWVNGKKTSYSFLKEAQQGGGNAPTGSLNRIMRELTTLRASLPMEYGAGIWVRMDEDRPQILKALVSGPMDTPYAHGLFEFDILLPAQYPYVPPKVLLVTTGGGTFRFNPNLYACGKVCLSLLGTWTGPGWQPGKSTLLQVLVSIQSLIMVPDPYFNEPGYERELNTPQGTQNSKHYNASIRRGTLQYAVLGQMQRPSPAFAEIIKNHFALRRTQILAQCEAWQREDSATPKRQQAMPDMARTVADIKGLLTADKAASYLAQAAAAAAESGGDAKAAAEEGQCVVM